MPICAYTYNISGVSLYLFTWTPAGILARRDLETDTCSAARHGGSRRKEMGQVWPWSEELSQQSRVRFCMRFRFSPDYKEPSSPKWGNGELVNVRVSAGQASIEVAPVCASFSSRVADQSIPRIRIHLIHLSHPKLAQLLRHPRNHRNHLNHPDHPVHPRVIILIILHVIIRDLTVSINTTPRSHSRRSSQRTLTVLTHTAPFQQHSQSLRRRRISLL